MSSGRSENWTLQVGSALLVVVETFPVAILCSDSKEGKESKPDKEEKENGKAKKAKKTPGKSASKTEPPKKKKVAKVVVAAVSCDCVQEPATGSASAAVTASQPWLQPSVEAILPPNKILFVENLPAQFNSMMLAMLFDKYARRVLFVAHISFVVQISWLQRGAHGARQTWNRLRRICGRVPGVVGEGRLAGLQNHSNRANENQLWFAPLSVFSLLTLVVCSQAMILCPAGGWCSSFLFVTCLFVRLILRTVCPLHTDVRTSFSLDRNFESHETITCLSPISILLPLSRRVLDRGSGAASQVRQQRTKLPHSRPRGPKSDALETLPQDCALVRCCTTTRREISLSAATSSNSLGPGAAVKHNTLNTHSHPCLFR